MSRKAVLERMLGREVAKKYLPPPKKPEVDILRRQEHRDIKASRKKKGR